jgi:dTDP-4-dehydrorhamnose reductase
MVAPLTSQFPVLVFGATGQLGLALRGRAPDRIVAVTRRDADLETQPHLIETLIAHSGAGAVINAAAHTQVDLAEAEPRQAYALNVEAPAHMARACAAFGLPLIHISTDYVFAGDQAGAWSETDPTRPLSLYGQTKLAGEDAVLAANPNALVIRTSWLVSEHRSNFVKTMLSLAQTVDRLRIVGDQQGVPTDADALAAFLLKAADQLVAGTAPSTGLLHFRNDGDPVTRAEFATAIFEQSGGPRPAIDVITSAEYGARAARPANSLLSIDRLKQIWRHDPPSWRSGVERIITALKTAD